MKEIKQEQPIICTFYMLQVALQSLHLNERKHMATLHDVWLKGAPTPDSRIQVPQGYDPRLIQLGNVERRIVLPKLLEAWMQDVGKTRGVPMTLADARKLIGAIKLGWGMT